MSFKPNLSKLLVSLTRQNVFTITDVTPLNPRCCKSKYLLLYIFRTEFVIRTFFLVTRISVIYGKGGTLSPSRLRQKHCLLCCYVTAFERYFLCMLLLSIGLTL